MGPRLSFSEPRYIQSGLSLARRAAAGIEYLPSREAFPPDSALPWERGTLVAPLRVVAGSRLILLVPQVFMRSWWLFRFCCTSSRRGLIAEHC